MAPRIAVAGNQWITQYLIEDLSRSSLAPSLIINLDPSWSSKVSGYVDLQASAETLGAALYRPKTYSLKAPEDEQALAVYPVDILIAFGWQRLIPSWLLRQCRISAIGVHGGPEEPPRCRGRAVFNWALLMGYTRFYMYVFELTPEVDNGDIFERSQFDILAKDDVLTLYHKNCVSSSRMMISTVRRLAAGTCQRSKQTDEAATYAPKRTPEQGGIDWRRSAVRVENLVRAVAPPYPGAFTEIEGQRIFLTHAHVFDFQIAFDATPGEVVDVFPNGHFIVQCGENSLYVREHYGFPPGLLKRGLRFNPVSGEQVPDPLL